MRTAIAHSTEKPNISNRISGLLAFIERLTSAKLSQLESAHNNAQCLQIGGYNDSLKELPTRHKTFAAFERSNLSTTIDLICNEAQLPFSAVFNCVLAPLHLYLIKDPRHYVNQLISILKPGGHLVLTTFGHYSLHEWKAHFSDDSNLQNTIEFTHPSLLKSWLPAQGYREITEEWIRLKYDSIWDFFRELQTQNEINLNPSVTLSALSQVKKSIRAFESQENKGLSFQLITLIYKKPHFYRDE